MTFKKSPANAAERLQAIKAVVLEVDGGMTDGGLFYGEQGESLKRFHVQDGQGIQLMRSQGLVVGIISGRSHPAVNRRAQELGIHPVFQGISDKLQCLKDWAQEAQLNLSEIAFMGDDLADLPVLKAVGFAVGVPNAIAEVQLASHWIADKPGGQGAVRCLADLFAEHAQ